MINKFSKAAKQAVKESKLWAYAAWTLPFVALGAVILEYYLGWENWVTKTIWAITSIFFAISVFWWWWALNKIVIIISAFKATEDRFNDVLDEIQKTRETLREIDADNRKWREQITNRSQKN